MEVQQQVAVLQAGDRGSRWLKQQQGCMPLLPSS